MISETCKYNFITLAVIVIVSLTITVPPCESANNNIHSTNHWVAENVNQIKKRIFNLGAGILMENDLPKVKNVILFIGDGMGLSTLTAARIFKGQKHGRAGEYENLVWDEFPALAHVKTFTANTQIGESAACANAMFTGHKTNAEVIGYDAKTHFAQCNATINTSHKLTNIFDWAQGAGLKTGFVTTTRVTHATPAALYAHVSSRYWEDDSKVPIVNRGKCKDIARQLLESTPGRNINVIMGGGSRSFLPATAYTSQSTPRSAKRIGRRLDGRNLVHEWVRDKNYLPAQYIHSRHQLRSIHNETEYLLGLFASSHMSFHCDRHRDDETKEQPTLVEMTESAIEVLSRNSKGFILVVESGRIDHAHHHNNAYRALDETLALEEAVNVAFNSNKIDLKDTLVIVTADHASGLVFSGYSTPLTSNIFGLDKQPSDVDLLRHPMLTYAAGPGQYSYIRDSSAKDTVQPSTIAKSWGNHGGEDVTLFATGAMSSVLFSGTVDQTYIAHAISYAMCLSIHADRCTQNFDYSEEIDNNELVQLSLTGNLNLTDNNDPPKFKQVGNSSNRIQVESKTILAFIYFSSLYIFNKRIFV